MRYCVYRQRNKNNESQKDFSKYFMMIKSFRKKVSTRIPKCNEMMSLHSMEYEKSTEPSNTNKELDLK